MTLIKSISGIRGTIGGRTGDTLNPLDIVKFTTAYAMFIRRGCGKPRGKVVVGRDARISGDMVRSVVCGTLVGMGFDVVDIGLATTPTTELAVRMSGADGGIIITASHNPRQWNALKLLNSEGEFLTKEDGNAVLAMAEAEDFCYADTPLTELSTLLQSPVHELRMAALLCMVEQFKSADDTRRTAIYNTYLAHTTYINNWDLVDLSAAQIVGGYLEHRDHAPLYQLAQSPLLWEQRIAIVATWQWIRRGQLDDTLAIADLLLHHEHDLIRKATGWMLREVGKKDKARLCRFLDSRYRQMPRTMLRYAIERFSPEERKHYMQKEK